ncbi:MAG: phenylalanine--tRNA ligase beta subunit-related protein [Anaerolineae bacterium]|jgi:DNA/RNA-binding domain of Phe-tRNA-synthetase-like protein|nr:phenylalanine--tRNA ligase beta subunit-related protein [Anaerolineae bacterium]
MLECSVTTAWRLAYPGATIGILELSGFNNVGASPTLNARKRELEARLRERYQGFTRRDFLALPIMAAYDRYYTRFNKTYHVQLQLESLVLKGKSLPEVSPAVDANFMAEVETLILTASHDVARLRGAIILDVTQAGEQMLQMNGTLKELRAGDMVMRDAEGVCCTIIYGQDARSPISTATPHALYVAYAPPGIAPNSVTSQLHTIETHVRLFSPEVVVEQQRIFTAPSPLHPDS